MKSLNSEFPATLININIPKIKFIARIRSPLEDYFNQNEMNNDKGDLLINKLQLHDYDEVYNHNQTFDIIYIEQIRDNIFSMFEGQNNCVLLFGPEMSGKSYLLKGEDEEDEEGILDRSVYDMFGLIDTNSTNNFYLKLRVSIYILINEYVLDLLSQEIKKFNQNDLENLNKIIILSKREFDVLLKKAYDKLENINNKNFSLIVSFTLEENSRFRNKISQFDFVKLVSNNKLLSDLNLSNRDKEVNLIKDLEEVNQFNLLNNNYFETFNDEGLRSLNNNFRNKTASNEFQINSFFNHLTNNFISNETNLLILASKNTCNKNSNILLITCLIPNQSAHCISLNTTKVHLTLILYF